MLLVENYSKKSNNYLTGKIDGGQTTHISSNNIKIGDYVKVLITEATPFALKSELPIDEPSLSHCHIVLVAAAK